MTMAPAAAKVDHAGDLDTEAISGSSPRTAATIQPADQGDTTTIEGTLETATRGLQAAGLAAPRSPVVGRCHRRAHDPHHRADQHPARPAFGNSLLTRRRRGHSSAHPRPGRILP
jgi:hypothetical protein